MILLSFDLDRTLPGWSPFPTNQSLPQPARGARSAKNRPPRSSTLKKTTSMIKHGPAYLSPRTGSGSMWSSSGSFPTCVYFSRHILKTSSTFTSCASLQSCSLLLPISDCRSVMRSGGASSPEPCCCCCCCCCCCPCCVPPWDCPLLALDRRPSCTPSARSAPPPLCSIPLPCCSELAGGLLLGGGPSAMAREISRPAHSFKGPPVVQRG